MPLSWTLRTHSPRCCALHDPRRAALSGRQLAGRALPLGVAERVASVVTNEWGQHLIGAWNGDGWWEAPRRVAARIAPLVGAVPGELTVADSTSVNLYKLLVAALRLQPGRKVIVTDGENFPTDLYLINEVAARVRRGGAPRPTRRAGRRARWLRRGGDLHPGRLPQRAQDPLELVTQRVHESGALMLWTCPIRPGRSRSTWAGPTPTWPWAVRTSTSTAGRGRLRGAL